MQILGIILVIIACTGVAVGAVLALYAWVVAMFILANSVADRERPAAGEFSAVGRLAIAGAISGLIGSASIGLFHSLSIKF